MNQELESRVKELIVTALELDDVRPDDIDAEAPLFGGGLGLDSIDALELAAAVDRTFHVKLTSDDGDTRAAFRSVRALSALIAARGGGL